VAVAFVQQVALDNSYGSIGGTSYTVSITPAPTAGNAVILAIFWKEITGLVTISSVVDSNGNTYTDCGAGKVARPSSGFIQIFGAKNVAAGTGTITVTFSGTGANQIAATALEYSGADTATLFDSVSASNTASSGATISATVTPTVASGAMLTMAFSNVGASATIDSGFNERYDDPGGGWENADKFFTSAPGATSPTVTWAGSFTAAVLILAVLRAATGAPVLSAAGAISITATVADPQVTLAF
jgi:hypothetical protein